MKHFIYGIPYLVLCLLFSCFAQPPKINGISFVGSPEAIDSTHTVPVVDINANWVCVMPFGFVRSTSQPNIVYNVPRQWWGERKDGAQETITLFQRKGLKVMLKPQLWIWHGEFTGHLVMNSEEDWKKLEKDYTTFIMDYATLAQETEVDLFCIGTELHNFVKARPSFWKQLISEIRSCYQGKITYAENWDSYGKVPFWEYLDYIGVNAYFPLSESDTPKIEELQSAWEPIEQGLRAMAVQWDRPILFTEYGYRSMDYTAKEPWNSERQGRTVNLKAQENALATIYDRFWEEEWFAGGFLWKWFHNHDSAGGTDNTRFTPQNKPAEDLIRDFYGRQGN